MLTWSLFVINMLIVPIVWGDPIVDSAPMADSADQDNGEKISRANIELPSVEDYNPATRFAMALIGNYRTKLPIGPVNNYWVPIIDSAQLSTPEGVYVAPRNGLYFYKYSITQQHACTFYIKVTKSSFDEGNNPDNSFGVGYGDGGYTSDSQSQPHWVQTQASGLVPLQEGWQVQLVVSKGYQDECIVNAWAKSEQEYAPRSTFEMALIIEAYPGVGPTGIHPPSSSFSWPWPLPPFPSETFPRPTGGIFPLPSDDEFPHPSP